jgi:hypothetical protein
MNNWNFTKKYTDHKTINFNNYAKFEVNWQRGSQLTARHTKNCLQTINSNSSVKFEVNWPRGSEVRMRHVKRTDGQWYTIIRLDSQPQVIVYQVLAHGRWLSPAFEKTTDLPQVTDKLYHIMSYPVHLAWLGFELTLVVIGTDCTGSCKSNYHTITTAPLCT